METTDSTQRPPWIDPLLREIVASIFEQSLLDGDEAEIRWSAVVEDDGCWCFDVFPHLVRGDLRGGHKEVECPNVRVTRLLRIFDPASDPCVDATEEMVSAHGALPRSGVHVCIDIYFDSHADGDPQPPLFTGTIDCADEDFSLN
jgi:hypothetical protein